MAERDREREERRKNDYDTSVTLSSLIAAHAMSMCVCVFVFGQTLSLPNYSQHQNSILFVESCLTIQNRQHFTASFYLYIDFTIVSVMLVFVVSYFPLLPLFMQQNLTIYTPIHKHRGKTSGNFFLLSSSLLLLLWWLLLLLLFISFCLRQCLFVRLAILSMSVTMNNICVAIINNL